MGCAEDSRIGVRSCLPCSSVPQRHWDLSQFLTLWSTNPFRDRLAEEKEQIQEANSPVKSTRDLPDAVHKFRTLGMVAVRASVGEVGVPLVDAACKLVEAVLLGVHSHLPGVHTDIELRAAPPGGNEEELVSLSIRFSPAPLSGEIATRTRIALGILIASEARFAIQRPGPDLHREPLVLRASGLEMPRLPDVVSARQRLLETIGEGLSPQSVFRWWKQNKDVSLPLQHSKLHRLVESFLGMRSMQLLPSSMHADILWAYLHTSDLDIDTFQLHLDEHSRVTVTMQQREPRSAEEAAVRAENTKLAKQVLVDKRASGEKLCPSAINLAAALYGPEVGQLGARPEAITKLLSAARWWDRGTEGWTVWDETWNCTDKKDAFGRVIEEQGRIIWRVAGDIREGVVNSSSRKDRDLAAGASRDDAITKKAQALGVQGLPIFCACVLLAFILYAVYGVLAWVKAAA